MYIPHHWHFFISLGISLLGFYIKQKLGNTYDVVIVFLVIQYHAIMHTIYIVVAGNMYQAYVTQTNTRRAPETEPLYDHNTGKIIGEVPVRNPVYNPPAIANDGWRPLKLKKVEQPVYSQVATLPRFDKERNFAVTMIRMYDYDPEQVDMTEAKWVKPGKFVRAEFVAMLENWEVHGVSGRANGKKNSKRVVKDWRKVRLIAQGNPLPPLPR
jgi:hypothetical protein